MEICLECLGGRGSAPDTAGGAHGSSPDSLVGSRGGHPSPRISSPRCRDPHAFGARCSVPRFYRPMF